MVKMAATSLARSKIDDQFVSSTFVARKKRINCLDHTVRSPFLRCSGAFCALFAHFEIVSRVDSPLRAAKTAEEQRREERSVPARGHFHSAFGLVFSLLFILATPFL